MRVLSLLIFLTIGYNSSAASLRQLLDSAGYYQSANTTKAILFADSALKLAKQQKNTLAVAECTFIIGKANYLNGDKDMALVRYLDAEKLYQQQRDTAGVIRVQTDICILYLKIKKPAQALSIIEAAIENAQKINNPDLLGTALNNKGLVFSDTHVPDSAVKYFLMAYDNYNTVGSKRGMAYSLDYLASVSMAVNKAPEAMAYLKQSILLLKECGDKMGEAVGINNIGELLLQQNKPAEAIPYFVQAVEKAKEIKFNHLEDNAWEMLADCYNKLGNYKSAYQAQVQHIRLQNKLVNASMLEKVEELSARYETGKKEQQNKLLRQQNSTQQLQLSRTRIITGGVVLVAILLIAVILQFYNRRKLKQEARFSDEMRQADRLRADSIVNAEENERRRLARELHDGIGQSLAAVRRNISAMGEQDAVARSVKMIDGAIREVRQLSHEMMPPWLRNKTLAEALRELADRTNESSDVEVHLELTDVATLQLDKVQVLMLYRCVQEIMTNVVTHSGATSATIEMVNHTNELSLMIYDDGKGFDVPAVMAAQGGIGLQNIISRVEYIGGTVEIDSRVGGGATFNISLPLKQTI